MWRFGVGVAALVGLRALLLALDVPGRWQTGRAPLAPLFSPERYGLVLFGGAARSLGDLLVTVAFLLMAGGAAVALVRRRRTQAHGSGTQTGRQLAARAALVAAGTAALLTLGRGLALLAEHSVLDSTLDVFARAGLWPPRYVALLLAALLGATLALVLAGSALAALVRRGLDRRGGVRAAPVVTMAAALGACAAGLLVAPPLLLALPFAGVCLVLGATSVRRLVLLRLRARDTVSVVLGLAALLYPLLWTGAEAQQRARMEDEAATFDESRDPRALFALTDVLNQAQADAALRRLLATPPSPERRAALDARAADLVRGSLLGNLGAYDVGLVVFTGDSLAARFAEGTTPPTEGFDREELALLRDIRDENGPALGPTVEPVTGRREADRFQYLGLVPLDGGGFRDRPRRAHAPRGRHAVSARAPARRGHRRAARAAFGRPLPRRAAGPRGGPRVRTLPPRPDRGNRPAAHRRALAHRDRAGRPLPDALRALCRRPGPFVRGDARGGGAGAGAHRLRPPVLRAAAHARRARAGRARLRGRPRAPGAAAAAAPRGRAVSGPRARRLSRRGRAWASCSWRSWGCAW